MKLYFITDDNAPTSHLEQVKLAFASGADLVQIRSKKSSKDEIKKIAIESLEISKKFNKKLIINDFPDICREVHADGVHISASDCSPSQAKELLGPSQIIGYTLNSYKDLKEISQDILLSDIDYIGLGPFRKTKTKENHKSPLGINGTIKMLNNIFSIKELPVFLIGGLIHEDIEVFKDLGLEDLGLDGVAVSSAINFSKDPSKTAKEFKNLLIKEL